MGDRNEDAEDVLTCKLRIQLTLDNCILPDHVLNSTPSAGDGLVASSEYQLRVIGCELIQSGGILLRLPQVAMATGQVLFHRFYYSKSFVRYRPEIFAMACVALASKIEEAPRSIREVIIVFHHMKQLENRHNQPAQPMLIDETYADLKRQVIQAEQRILKELGFCVHIKHPHKFIVTLLQVLEMKDNRLLTQTAWNYMNDSLRTDLFVRYSPETIACSCVYLSARVLKIALPESPPWFEIFGTNQTQIESVCCKLLQLYTIGRPLKSNLDEQLINLRQRLKSQKDDPKYARDDSTSKPENGAKSSALNMEQVEKGQVKVIERTEDVSSAITNRTIDVDRHLESHSKALHSSSSVSLSSLSTSYARDYNKHTRGRTREYDDSSSTRRHRDREREVTSDDSIRSRHKKRSKHDSDVRNDYKRERR